MYAVETGAAGWLAIFVVNEFGIQQMSIFAILAVLWLFLILVHLGFSSGAAMASSGLSPWITAAVGYQQLYTRDTLAYADDNPAATSKIVDDIRREDQLALRIPDLSSAGLTFKSVRRLHFNNKPLVQIVYLPETGPPIALCVMKGMKSDQAVAAQVVDTMHVVTWRQAELSYALIGKTESVDLDALGKRISNREVDQLFSNATSALFALAG